MGKKLNQYLAASHGVSGARLTSETPLRTKYDGVRDWGAWSILDQEARYKVKRLVIQPGKTLSYQCHAHRDENWTVVVGTVELAFEGRSNVIDPQDISGLFIEGEGFVVRPGEWHQVRNPGKICAVVIEVQTGVYLEEDDIERDPNGPFDGDNDESEA